MPWFLTGVTQPFVRQSTSAGRPLARTHADTRAIASLLRADDDKNRWRTDSVRRKPLRCRRTSSAVYEHSTRSVQHIPEL